MIRDPRKKGREDGEGIDQDRRCTDVFDMSFLTLSKGSLCGSILFLTLLEPGVVLSKQRRQFSIGTAG